MSRTPEVQQKARDARRAVARLRRIYEILMASTDANELRAHWMYLKDRLWDQSVARCDREVFSRRGVSMSDPLNLRPDFSVSAGSPTA